MKKVRSKTLILALTMFLCALITAGLWTQKAQAASDKMTIYAIDMGKGNPGEATMVVGGNGGSLLIDTGDSDTNNLFYWLNSHKYGSKKFDLLVTHWHEDHAVNASKVINNYNIGKVYIPSADYLTNRYDISLYTRLVRAAKSNGTKIVYMKKGQTISVGNNIKGKVLYVNGSPKSENSDEDQMINNESAAVLFTGGGSRFLTCGDLQREAEQRIVNSGQNIKADIYKMSHHGYPASNIREFVKKVNPSYVWFTTYDASPSYYCPPSVYDAVRRMSATCNVLSTRYNGTIRFLCASGKISVSAERNTNVMYRKIENIRTGNMKTVRYVFNNQGVPRLTDKVLDSFIYTSSQVQYNGRMFAGSWTKDNGHWRLVDTKGLYAVDTLAKCNERYCLINDIGIRYDKGWIELDGKRYYFDPYRASGFKKIKGRTYYFIDKNYSGYTTQNEGTPLTGFVTIKGRRYYLIDKRCKTFKEYLRGVMATGWNTISGKKYYMNSRGVIQKGLKKIGDNTYYFSPYGIMCTGLKNINGSKYYFNNYGKMQTGWMMIEGKIYYAYKNGKFASGTKTINGVTYRFDTFRNGCALLSDNAPKNVRIISRGSGVSKKATGGLLLAPGTTAEESVAAEQEPGTTESATDSATGPARESATDSATGEGEQAENHGGNTGQEDLTEEGESENSSEGSSTQESAKDAEEGEDPASGSEDEAAGGAGASKEEPESADTDRPGDTGVAVVEEP